MPGLAALVIFRLNSHFQTEFKVLVVTIRPAVPNNLGVSCREGQRQQHDPQDPTTAGAE